ncbi:MAG: putative lipid II flippase FtsW [Patescibacteria group bacterium]|nr:putative lipid II flippase FtsW [Patescibacteria group bacterium]
MREKSRTYNRVSSPAKTGQAAPASNYHEPNYTLIILLGVIIIFGLIMLSSASSVMGWQKFGDHNYFVKHQLLYGVIIGLVAFWVMSKIDYHYWKKYAFPIVIISIVLLFLVLIPGIGYEFLGAKRWVSIFGFPFQPSELVKLTFLIYLATWLEQRSKKMEDFSYSFMPFIIMIAFLVFMVAGIQRDLGTMIVIGVVSIVIYFVAGAPWKHLGWIGLGGLGLFFLLIKIAPYRAQRLTVFLNPELDPQGVGYHINQSLLAIGSGGLFGLGLGHSRQKFNYLPEAAGDSIFAVIAEEMGFVITVALVALFFALGYQCLKIARNAPDAFGKLLAVGIVTWILFQAFVNIMAMLGLLPLTGITLPFISYGSTSLVTLLAAMGLLVNISRQTKKNVNP